jgi:P4 family phage/plasmid primase-like protien
MLNFEYETVNTINVDEIQKMKKLLDTSSDFVAGKKHWTYLLTPQLMTEIACNCGVLYDMKSTKYNPFFIAILYLLFNNLVYEKNEGDFFQYDQTTGLWHATTAQVLVTKIQHFVMELDYSSWGLDSFPACDYGFCEKILRILKGYAEQENIFVRPKDKHFVHTKNTMLEYSPEENKWLPCDFSPDYKSRNRTDIEYKPEAQAPRFFAELLKPAMSDDDIETLQLYVGQVLLGVNLSQRLLMITGTAGGGKSTLVNVIEQLISRVNCTQLRMEGGSNRFETSRYVGKTLLTAKDVNSQFLNHRHAGCLKALTGGDILSVEYKGSNMQTDITGDFNVIIVSNSTLQLRTDNDVEAWRRRLLWIKYHRTPTKHPIADFDKLLIETEGSGILNWALEGARKLLESKGKIYPSKAQAARIEELLDNADPLLTYVKKHLIPAENANMTTEEIWNYFSRYCHSKEVPMCKKSVFLHVLPDIMEQEHSLCCRNDIKRNGKAKRGYAGITLNCQNQSNL